MRIHNLTEGWSKLPPINREKYQSRNGLEGPIQTKSGKTVYYDPKAGKYYDPDTDMYMSYDEWKQLDEINRSEWDDNEAHNMHSENALELIMQFGDDQEKAEMQEIYDRHMKLGHIEMEDLTRRNELVRKYFGQLSETENTAMQKALRSIEKTFGPERKAIDDQVLAMLRTVEMLKNPRYADRAWSNVEKYGISSKQELVQELMIMIKNEQQVDDDEIYGVERNIKNMEKAIADLKGGVQTESLEKALTEAEFDEAAGEKDACYRKVKSRYKVWPSAYASGALVKCRKVGAKNWGNKK